VGLVSLGHAWGLTGLLVRPPRRKITWINVYSSSFSLQAQIRHWKSLRYCQRISKPGTMELTFHRSAVGAQYLVEGSWVEVIRNGVTVWVGRLVGGRKLKGETGEASEFKTVQAYCANDLVYSRVIVPPEGQSHLVAEGKVDDVLKFFVRKSLVSGYAEASRVLPGFTVEADTSQHPSTKKLAGRYQDNLGKFLENCAKAYGLDWWVEADLGSGTFVFRTGYPQKGEDKTDKVIFSVSRRNVLDLQYWEDGLDKASLVYVGGPGSGAAQVVQEFYEGAEPTGFDRQEAFVAATDAQYASQLEVYGKAYLETFGQTVTGVRFAFQENESCRWGVDFELGDLVTVYDPDWDISVEAKINEIQVRIEEDGIEKISLLVGQPHPTEWEQLQARIGPYESFNDQEAPATPTGLSYSVGTYQDDQGVWYAKLELDWDDNSELDLACYVAEIRRSGEEKWQAQRVTESEAIFEGLQLGGSYYARVKAVDSASNESDYANFNGGAAISMPEDVYPPSAPTGVTAEGVLKGIRISVDRPPEKDWAVTEFHVSTSSGFTPGPSTLVHGGKTTTYTYQTTSYVTHYVKVRHGDASGNFSSYSAEVSATPEKVSPDPDIPPNSIPDNRIIDVDWAKIKNVAIEDADILNLSVNKLTAGGLNCAVTIQSGGKFEVSGKFRIDSSAIHILGTQGLKFYYGSNYIYLFYNSQQRLEAGGAFQCGQLHVDGYAYFYSKVYISGSELIMQGNVIRLGSSAGYPYLYNPSGNEARCGGYWHFLSDVTVAGDFSCNGTKNAIVQTSQGYRLMSAIESPEVLFVDRASGLEQRDQVVVRPDPLFLETLDESGDLWLIPAYRAFRLRDKVVARKEDKIWWVLGIRRGFRACRFREVKDAENDSIG